MTIVRERIIIDADYSKNQGANSTESDSNQMAGLHVYIYDQAK